MKVKHYLLAVLALSFSATQLNAQETATILKSPTVKTIDGDLSDWGADNAVNNAIKMETVNPDAPWVPQDNKVFWMTTWDDVNLYVAIAVVDVNVVEYVDDSKGDFLQLVFGPDVSNTAGWGNDAANIASRLMFEDGGTTKIGGEIGADSFITVLSDDIFGQGSGYIVEAQYSLATLGITGADGTEFLFDVQVKDYDQYYEDDQWKDNGAYQNFIGWGVPNYNTTWATMANVGVVTMSSTEETLSNEVAKMAELEFTLSPNPSTRNLNVKIASDINNIKVYSVTGQILNNIEVANKKSVSVNVENLESGLYILQVQTSEGMFAKRFLKK